MNYSMVRFTLFRLLRVMGTLLILPLIVALVYREYDSALSFFLMALGSIVIGSVFSLKKPKNKVIYAR